MRAVFLLLASLFSPLVARASSSEEFFTAYQAAQVSGLSKIISTQAHNPQVIADTVASLEKAAKTAKTSDNAATEKTKESYQNQVLAYLNSPQADSYFDSLATDLLAKAYSYEELKSLYQLYTDPTIQNFLPNEINFGNQQNSKNYISNFKFNQQLEDKVKQILDSVQIEAKNTETLANSQLPTPPKETEPKVILSNQAESKTVIPSEIPITVKPPARLSTPLPKEEQPDVAKKKE